MKRVRFGAGLLTAGLLAAACGGGPAVSPASSTESSEGAKAVRVVLEDAEAAANRFGQAHLGHFLKMTPGDLTRDGLEVPSDISIAVLTDHTSYCIRAASSDLPSKHPWAVATLISSDRMPTAADRCTL